jgi:hypothetical protein
MKQAPVSAMESFVTGQRFRRRVVMLELSEVDKIARKAAAKALKKGRVARVYSKPMIDSIGEEALDVTIVIKRGARAGVNGASALEAIYTIGRDLDLSGEERQAVITFVTEEELEEEEWAEGDDPEP